MTRSSADEAALFDGGRPDDGLMLPEQAVLQARVDQPAGVQLGRARREVQPERVGGQVAGQSAALCESLPRSPWSQLLTALRPRTTVRFSVVREESHRRLGYSFLASRTPYRFAINSPTSYRARR